MQNTQSASTNKYYSRKVMPEEFNELLRDSGLKIRDFMALTGRHSNMVAIYQGKVSNPGNQAPTMSDILVLEVAKRHPEMRDVMLDIAAEYSAG